MTKSENAALWFADTFNCSQAVLTSFGQDYGLTEEQCLKIGCAFGGGMARRQMTCGAVTGALMALGLHFGRGENDPYSQTGTAYEKTNAFFEEFTKLNGSITCRDLLQGLDMNDPVDKEKIRELELFTTSCAKYVQDAVRITETLIGKGVEPLSPGIENKPNHD
jgi:C_GCAxxG_C_C family probable redox protein